MVLPCSLRPSDSHHRRRRKRASALGVTDLTMAYLAIALARVYDRIGSGRAVYVVMVFGLDINKITSDLFLLYYWQLGF
jgi:hypothetical protein